MAPRRRREYGTGSVFPKDGRWLAQVGYRAADGRRRYVTRTLRDERSAKLALPALLARVGIEGIEPRQTLDRFLAEWLSRIQPSISAATLTSYTGHVRMHIGPLVGGIPVDDLRPVDVDRLVLDRKKAGLSPATIVRILTTLSMALEQGVREGVLSRNVAKLVRRPRVDRSSHVQAMAPAEAGRILEHIAGDVHEALYVLLLGSGLRVGEAVALDWRDVDLERGVVTVRSGKTARARRVAKLVPWAVRALREHRARSPIVGAGEPVFRGVRKGERLRTDVAYAHWRQLLGDVGLPPMRQHDLRHGHVSLLLYVGADMRLIADQVGHADPSLTARTYAHVVAAQLEAKVVELGDVVPTRLTDRLTDSGR